jgi:hypothetical protein
VVAECLSSKYKALSSNSSTAKKTEERERGRWFSEEGGRGNKPKDVGPLGAGTDKAMDFLESEGPSRAFEKECSPAAIWILQRPVRQSFWISDLPTKRQLCLCYLKLLSVGQLVRTATATNSL